jgi:hypothetical protein
LEVLDVHNNLLILNCGRRNAGEEEGPTWTALLDTILLEVLIDEMYAGRSSCLLSMWLRNIFKSRGNAQPCNV